MLFRSSYTRASGSVEWRLIISGQRNMRAFAERVGFMPTKQAKLAELIQRAPVRPHRLSADRVPFVADFVRSELPFDMRGTGRKWLTTHNFDRVERWDTERSSPPSPPHHTPFQFERPPERSLRISDENDG